MSRREKLGRLCNKQLYYLFEIAVFRKVMHGMFTSNAAPFNAVYFLSVLANHMYLVEEFQWVLRVPLWYLLCRFGESLFGHNRQYRV